MINIKLAEKQGLSESAIAKIEELHSKRSDIFESVEKMQKTGYKKEIQPEIFKELYGEWIDIEHSLQTLWKFGVDDNKIRFWNFPACSCAKVDNEEAYPTGFYSMSGGCVIHGDIVNNKKG